jgi:hypothetical protein
MSVSVIADALASTVKYFEDFPELASKAMSVTLNQVSSREALPLIRKEMRSQVNFPKGYLEMPDRLFVARKANKQSLETVIRGRDQATSLARFRAPGQDVTNTRGRGVRVQVSRGQTAVMRRAFLVKLRNGNMGLAIRLKPGEQIRNTTGAKSLENNVYLLYGPSVDQVFRTVAGDVAPDVLESVTREFFRQFARMSFNG